MIWDIGFLAVVGFGITAIAIAGRKREGFFAGWFWGIASMVWLIALAQVVP